MHRGRLSAPAGARSPASRRRRAWIALGATLLGVALAGRLGLWQLDRAQQKLDLQRTLIERQAMPPLDLAALPRRGDEVAAVLQRRVRLHGRWLAERTVFLDNRQMDGKPGFFVVTPLLIGEGSADAVLVERGWVARNFADRSALPPVATPSGPVEVAGQLAATPSRMFELAPDAGGTIRQNLELASFARETGLALRPVVIVQHDEAAQPSSGLLRHWPAPASDVQKHYGYAVQWFAIAAALGALYVWYRFIRPRQRSD